jgi:hypothetical protein
VAVRALAFKWIRIIYRCWQTGTPYDEVKYLEGLRRKAPRYSTMRRRIRLEREVRLDSNASEWVVRWRLHLACTFSLGLRKR